MLPTHLRLCALLLAAVLPGPGWGAAAPDGSAVVERDCVACHNVTGPAPDTLQALLERKAPDLFYAGSKFNRAWLVEWLQDPTPIRRAGVVYLEHIALDSGKDRIAVDTVTTCAARLSPEVAESVSDYLMALTDPAMQTGVVDPAKKFSEPKALRLFRKQLPCVGCHTIRWGKRTIGGVSGPSLIGAGNRLNPDWIYARIENPQHWDPKTWMPRVPMSRRKRELLTRFIASMDAGGAPESAGPKAALVGPAISFGEFVTPKTPHSNSAERDYRLYCVQCHGSQGSGQGINDTAGGLSVSPKNHVSAENMSELSDEEIRAAIAEGGDAVQKSGLMPPWGETLSPAQIGELVIYLRKLCAC